MENAFRSARLIYRALELPDDEAYLLKRQSEPAVVAGAYPGLLRPSNKQTIQDIKKHFDSNLLTVVICLPAKDETEQPTPIGEVSLHGIEPAFAHHRRSSVGISLLSAYHGKGYGTEAIEWILEWGFQKAGLHRIGIGAFAWNTRAWALYERIGFVHEGRARDWVWYDGAFHDSITMSMLEHEWRARRDKKLEEAKAASNDK